MAYIGSGNSIVASSPSISHLSSSHHSVVDVPLQSPIQVDKPLPPIRLPLQEQSVNHGHYVRAPQAGSGRPDLGQSRPREHRYSRMSLFINLFGKPKVEKLRGYAEPGLPPLPVAFDAINQNHPTRHQLDSARIDKPLPRTHSRQHLERSPTPLPTIVSEHPLSGIYSQSVMVGAAYGTGAEAGSILRLQPIRKKHSSPFLSASLEGRESADFRRSTRLHLGSSAAQTALPRKIFALSNGSLYQYSDRGPMDRSPERSLELTRDTIAIASDLVPGRPYTLQIAQAMNRQGQDPAQPSSLFSRIGFKGQGDKRQSTTMLIVLDNAQEMEDWLRALRKEIQMLGGHMDFSKAVDMQKRELSAGAPQTLEPGLTTKGHSRNSSYDNKSAKSRSSNRRSRMDPVLHHQASQPSSPRRLSSHASSPVEGRSPIEKPDVNPQDSPLAHFDFGTKALGSNASALERSVPQIPYHSPAKATRSSKSYSDLSPTQEVPDPVRQNQQASVHQPLFSRPGSAQSHRTSSEQKLYHTGRSDSVLGRSTRADKIDATKPNAMKMHDRDLDQQISDTNQGHATQAKLKRIPSYGSFKDSTHADYIRSGMPATIPEHPVANQNPQVRGLHSRASPSRKPSPLPIVANGKILYRASSSTDLSSQLPVKANENRRYSSMPLRKPVLDNVAEQGQLNRTNLSTNTTAGECAAQQKTEPSGLGISLPNSRTAEHVKSQQQQTGQSEMRRPKPAKISLFPSAASSVSPPLTAHSFPHHATSNPTARQRRPVSLQVKPHVSKSLHENGSGEPVARSTADARTRKPVLHSSRSAMDLRHPMTSVSEISIEHNALTYDDIAEEVDNIMLPIQGAIEPDSSPVVELGATVSGPLTLPKLDFGMPVVGLAPPAPPPQAPLPQLPKAKRAASPLPFAP